MLALSRLCSILALTTLCFLPTYIDALMDVAWWSSVAQLNMASMLSSYGSRPACPQLAGLSPGQARICEVFRDHMPAVGSGAYQAIQECQHQFKNHRWNCSTPDVARHVGPFHKLTTREAAFTHAIMAAGVTHEISRRCKLGTLSSCGCSDEPRPKEIKEDWAWSGCGDNVKYGYRFARDFIDVREKEESMKRAADDQRRSLVNRWNNEAGRRIIKRHTKSKCKCHGVSGACNLKTCWFNMPDMRSVGEVVLDKYNKASRVIINARGNMQMASSEGKNSNEARPRSARRLKTDLFYLDDSPDYCRYDRAMGTIGTQGRLCRKDSKGPEGCDFLCCGRGYNSHTVQTTTKCSCKFEWCCQVICDSCVETTVYHTCK